MPYDFRIATIQDCSAVEAIVKTAYARYVSLIGMKPAPMRDDYADLIQKRRIHVVGLNGVIQGILVLIPEDNAMLLDNVAVAPTAQGIGLGRKLLAFAEEVARREGYRSIRLYTNEAMKENIGLYSRIGYIETHRGEEKGLRRVYMTKMLV